MQIYIFTIEALFTCPSTTDWIPVQYLKLVVFRTDGPYYAHNMAVAVIQTFWERLNLPISPIGCNIRLLSYYVEKNDLDIGTPIYADDVIQACINKMYGSCSQQLMA